MSEDMALLSRIILTSASKQPPVALTPAGQGTLTATVLRLVGPTTLKCFAQLAGEVMQVLFRTIQVETRKCEHVQILGGNEHVSVKQCISPAVYFSAP
jgi:hypothetical protein